MTDLKDKVLEQSTNPGLKYMNISRRAFLKGAVAVGGALALAGCGNGSEDKTTATTTTATAADTSAPTVGPKPPDKVSYPSNMPTKSTTGNYIIPDYAKCVGCKKCMVACSYHHYGEPDLFKSNIRVDMAYIEGGRADMPFLCMKCGGFTAPRAATETAAATEAIYGTRRGSDANNNPVYEDDIPCHAACPPGANAIYKDPDCGWAMRIDPDKCTACGNCVTACKEKGVGILRLSKDMLHVYGMCDHCGDGYPRCVLACPEDCLMVKATAANMPNQIYIVKPEKLAKQVIGMVFGLEIE